jgi:hypothetical protein
MNFIFEAIRILEVFTKIVKRYVANKRESRKRNVKLIFLL